MGELLADSRQAVDEGRALALGEVQRFVDLVGEEGVLADMAPEVGAADQIGVEAERIALGLELLACILDADDLPGGEADDRSLLIIVALAAVDQVAILLILEEYHVEAERMPHVAHGTSLRKVDHAHQRMQRLHAEPVVVFGDGLDIQQRLLHRDGFAGFVPQS